MPSLLPPRPMIGNYTSCFNQSSRKIEQLTGMYMSDDSNKSGFLKMNGRKKKKTKNQKRPPPISISVGSVNVIMAGNTFNPRAVCDGSWTPPIPQTPPLAPCMKQLCREVHDYLTATPTHSQKHQHHHHHPSHIWPPLMSPLMSSTMSSHTELPAVPSTQIAELPGSEPSQHTQSLFKLDSEQDSDFSTACTVIALSQDSSLESLPELSPSTSSDSEMEKTRTFPFSTPKAKEPVKNGKLLSYMDVDELLDILPDLTSAEIKEFWLPLIAKEVYILKQTVKGYQEAENSDLEFHKGLGIRVDSAKAEKEAKEYENLVTNMEIERAKKECEARLKLKDAEIATLTTAYETEAKILCTFVDQFHGAQLDNSSDPSMNGVRSLVRKHCLRDDDGVSSQERAEYIFVPAKDFTAQKLEIQKLEFQLDDLEALATYHEEKLGECAGQIKRHRKEIKGYKKDEYSHNQEIVDKDLQIAALNKKITQMLTMQTHHSGYTSGGGSASGTGGFLPSSRFEKDLPSPSPSEWRREQEAKDDERKEQGKRAQEVKEREWREEMMQRVPAESNPIDSLFERREIGNISESERTFLNKFRTLNVEGEDFPFYMAN